MIENIKITGIILMALIIGIYHNPFSMKHKVKKLEERIIKLEEKIQWKYL